MKSMDLYDEDLSRPLHQLFLLRMDQRLPWLHFLDHTRSTAKQNAPDNPDFRPLGDLSLDSWWKVTELRP